MAIGMSLRNHCFSFQIKLLIYPSNPRTRVRQPLRTRLSERVYRNLYAVSIRAREPFGRVKNNVKAPVTGALIRSPPTRSSFIDTRSNIP